MVQAMVERNDFSDSSSSDEEISEDFRNKNVEMVSSDSEAEQQMVPSKPITKSSK